MLLVRSDTKTTEIIEGSGSDEELLKDAANIADAVLGDRPEYPDGTFEAMAQALAQMQECGRQLRGLAGKRTETPMQQAVRALLAERCRAAEGMLEKTERLDEKTEAFFRGFSMELRYLTVVLKRSTAE